MSARFAVRKKGGGGKHKPPPRSKQLQQQAAQQRRYGGSPPYSDNSSRSSSRSSSPSDDDDDDDDRSDMSGDGGGGNSSTSDVEDAEDYRKGGYHPVQVGEKFKQGRYVVLKKLGWGHFSTVWLVLDARANTFAALKVQKSAQHYTEAARDEITLLSQIRDGDSANAKHCCRLLDSFEHAGPHGLHVCMVFEVLGDNLLALIKHYDYRGAPLGVVRALTRQMLVALDYLHRERSIIHTDFKPENVMLAETLSPRRWEMTLAPPPSAAPRAAAAGAAGGAAGAGAAAAGGAGGGLTKNQKKKAKRRAKKAAAAASGGAASSMDVSSSGALDGSDDEEEAGLGPLQHGVARARRPEQHLRRPQGPEERAPLHRRRARRGHAARPAARRRPLRRRALRAPARPL